MEWANTAREVKAASASFPPVLPECCSLRGVVLFCSLASEGQSAPRVKVKSPIGSLLNVTRHYQEDDLQGTFTSGCRVGAQKCCSCSHEVYEEAV